MRKLANDNRGDEMLMAAYQEGDMAAFEQLYGRYEQKIYNFLLRRLGDKELCHDLFQEIFLKLHRARHEFDPQQSFSTWLFTIVNNTMKNEFKRLTRLKVRVETLLVESAPSNHNGCADPECNLVCDERSREIEKALAALPEAHREVILLNKYSGFSYAEIAQITGSSEAAVKQKAHRGFMQLREILQGRIEPPNPNPDKPEPLRAQPNGKKLLVSGFYESSGLKSNGLNPDDSDFGELSRAANPDTTNFKVTHSSILSAQQEVRL